MSSVPIHEHGTSLHLIRWEHPASSLTSSTMVMFTSALPRVPTNHYGHTLDLAWPWTPTFPTSWNQISHHDHTLPSFHIFSPSCSYYTCSSNLLKWPVLWPFCCLLFYLFTVCSKFLSYPVKTERLPHLFASLPSFSPMVLCPTWILLVFVP